MKNYNYLFILTLLFPTSLGARHTKAVCIVPVVDLVATPLTASPNLPIAYAAGAQPVEPARIHQLLFNEVVTVKEVKNNQALIEMPNLFYETAQTTHKQTTYWVPKDTLLFFDRMTADPHTFPTPLQRNTESFSTALHNTAALTMPWFDSTTSTTYSAGTRFVCSGTDPLAVFIFDATKGTAVVSRPPASACRVHQKKTHEEQIADFVALVKKWAHLDTGYIPYVWGGCSVLGCCTNPFTQRNQQFIREEMPTPYAGLDCTGLVTRAAQLVGIPFFYKNSITMARHLKALQPEESMVAGDLIWIPGHIMVMSDVEKGLLVEARHYQQGYGKVHEISLAQQFQGMTSYERLRTTCSEHRPLKRLNNKGEVVQVIADFKILKLASVWHAA